jgi:hypothetical protein
MDTTKIREHMQVYSNDNSVFGTVDKVEGESIKLTKDMSGQHHYIPTSWVEKVDDKVYLNRSRDEANARMEERGGLKPTRVPVRVTD